MARENKHDEYVEMTIALSLRPLFLNRTFAGWFVKLGSNGGFVEGIPVRQSAMLPDCCRTAVDPNVRRGHAHCLNHESQGETPPSRARNTNLQYR